MPIPTPTRGTLTRRAVLGGLAGLAAATAAACGTRSNPLADSSGSPSGGAQSLIVGSANFSESNVLAELYAQAMTAKGVQASTKNNIGDREAYLQALGDGSIALVPEYTGNLLQYLNAKATAQTADQVLSQLKPLVDQKGWALLDQSKAVDQDVYCVTKAFSTQHGVKSLADLKKVAATSVIGGPPELKQRPYGPQGLKAVYGATFKGFEGYPSPAVKVKDLVDDKIQVADFFTTDAAIAQNGLVELTDPQLLILPQNVIPLVTKAVAQNQTAVAAVNAVQAVLTTADLTDLVKQIDIDKKDAAAVAGAWLKTKSLG